MARASSVRLYVLQQMCSMVASVGVIIPAPSGGMPGRHAHGCLLSPSGRRAEHEVARSCRPSGPGRGGQRPNGQEHVRARSNVKCPLGANPRTGFKRYPLRSGWTLVRSYAACTAWSLTESTSGRSRWSEETRSDLDCTPQVARDDHSGVSERLQPSRQGSAESVGEDDRGRKPQMAAQQPHDGLAHSSALRPFGLLTGVVRAEPTKAADTCRVALTERSGGRASAVSRKLLTERSDRRSLTTRWHAEPRKFVQGEFVWKVFGGLITVVLWLAGLLLRSCPFLSSRSSASFFATTTRSPCLCKWTGRQEVQPTTSSSCPRSATSSRRPIFIAVVSPPIRVSSAGGLPVVYDNRFGSTICYTVYLLWQRSKMGPVLAALLVVRAIGTRQWVCWCHHLCSLLRRSTLSYNTLAGFSSHAFSGVSSRRQACNVFERDCRIPREFFREIPRTSRPRVLRHFGRTQQSPVSSDAWISQNVLTSSAHGPGWPSWAVGFRRLALRHTSADSPSTWSVSPLWLDRCPRRQQSFLFSLSTRTPMCTSTRADSWVGEWPSGHGGGPERGSKTWAGFDVYPPNDTRAGQPHKRWAGVRETHLTQLGEFSRDSRESEKGKVLWSALPKRACKFPGRAGVAERQVTHSSASRPDVCKRTVHECASDSSSWECRGWHTAEHPDCVVWVVAETQRRPRPKEVFFFFSAGRVRRASARESPEVGRHRVTSGVGSHCLLGWSTACARHCSGAKQCDFTAPLSPNTKSDTCTTWERACVLDMQHDKHHIGCARASATARRNHMVSFNSFNSFNSCNSFFEFMFEMFK